MIRGVYRNRVYTACGCLRFDSGWSSNTLVDTTWPLIAGLLKNQARWHGIRFWAIGTGEEAWDLAPVPANPRSGRLVNEIRRNRIRPDDIVWLDTQGEETDNPTTRIEVRSEFSWPRRDQTLREFGLFGGDATRDADSGQLINYVIHPRIDLNAGETLSRSVRFSLRTGAGLGWLAKPEHWLGASPVQDLDGVGPAYARALAAADVETIRELADVEPLVAEIEIPQMKLVELRVKALLTLQTASNILDVPGLAERSLWEVIVTPTATLASEAGAPEGDVLYLREQVSGLQLTLDNKLLRRLTIGELTNSSA